VVQGFRVYGRRQTSVNFMLPLILFLNLGNSMETRHSP
jgi:hypothetical protein